MAEESLAGLPTDQPQEDKEKRQRRPRATKAEMERRFSVVRELISTNGYTDAKTVESALKINHPQVVNLLEGMVKAGQIERAGRREGRRVAYVLRDQAVLPAQRMERVPLNSILEKIHPGLGLKVSSVTWTEDDASLDLVTPGGEHIEVEVALVS